MKIYVHLFLTAVLLIITFDNYCYSYAPHQGVIKIHQGVGPGGLWQSKTQWKAHWVKHWEARKIWVPVWQKVWGPVEVKEWIPLPKPPSASVLSHPT